MILLTGITQPYLAVTGYDEGIFLDNIGNLNFLSLDGKRWATPITGRSSRFSNVDYHYRYDQCTIKPIIFWGAQLSGPVSSTKLKPTNISTLYLSVRYSGYPIKTSKIKFLGLFEDFTKIASPKNYRLYNYIMVHHTITCIYLQSHTFKCTSLCSNNRLYWIRYGAVWSSMLDGTRDSPLAVLRTCK